jgi:uncharacterized delta-60 repeat protein
MAIGPDERIVVVGSIGGVIDVKRYLPDGTPDPSFDQDGAGAYLHPAFGVIAHAVAIQPDLKIVVVGYADAHPAHYVVARLTPTGALDASFDGDGWLTTDFERYRRRARGFGAAGREDRRSGRVSDRRRL